MHRTVSLFALIHEIASNPVAAATKYAGKSVVTKGKVASIRASRDGSSTVVLSKGDYSLLWCEFQPSELSSIARLRDGRILQVEGVIKLQQGIAPTLSDCKILTTKASVGFGLTAILVYTVWVGILAPLLVGLVVIGLRATGTIGSVQEATHSPVVLTNGCSIRAEPSKSSERIGFASAGEYAVEEISNGWRRIRTSDGTGGWVGCRD